MTTKNISEDDLDLVTYQLLSIGFVDKEFCKKNKIKNIDKIVAILSRRLNWPIEQVYKLN